MSASPGVPPAVLSPALQALTARLQARGLADPAAALIDAFEPVMVLSAQALLMAQPLAGLAGSEWYQTVGDLAAALETPEGTRALRAALREPESRPRG